MGHERDGIPPGTLDLLVLRSLSRGAQMHGFEIADFIQKTTESVLSVEEGSLYPALQRLLLNGWVSAAWGRTVENRRARYYTLTKAGRKQLEREVAKYRRVAHAIGRVLQAT